MRKNFGKKTWTCMEPVFIIGTYNEDGTPNAMNAAWAGIYDTNKVYISLATHKTTDNFKRTGAFSVSFGTLDQVVACDYVGVVSGKAVPDKVEKAGWTAVKCQNVNAPYFDELKIALECTVSEIKEDEEGIKLVGDIVNVSADDSVLTDGNVDFAKLKPITFDPFTNNYFVAENKVCPAFTTGVEFAKKK